MLIFWGVLCSFLMTGSPWPRFFLNVAMYVDASPKWCRKIWSLKDWTWWNMMELLSYPQIMDIFYDKVVSEAISGNVWVLRNCHIGRRVSNCKMHGSEQEVIEDIIDITWWQLKIICYVHPENWGKFMIQFWACWVTGGQASTRSWRLDQSMPWMSDGFCNPEFVVYKPLFS